MRPINVRVGHQDDPVVAQLRRLELLQCEYYGDGRTALADVLPSSGKMSCLKLDLSYRGGNRTSLIERFQSKG